MSIFYHYNRGGKRLQRKSKSENNLRVRLAALLLCLFMLPGFLPVLASAADDEGKLSSIVTFDSITLHCMGDDGQPEAAIQDGTLIERDRKLVLRYTYNIKGEQCEKIKAGTKYYLEVSPHLVLPHLEDGSSLTVDGKQQFGSIYANGNSAWVTFDAKQDGSGDTVLSDYGELSNAFFYLNCSRAVAVPAGEDPIDGYSNLYAIKFENNRQVTFGYAENEPVTARAQINKGGNLQDKTITWTINYTPWQNPAANDPVTLDTPFELRDTIDISSHSYVAGSVTIDGTPVTAAYTYTSRDEIQGGEDAYVIVETSADGGSTTLTFGGTKFNAGEATQGNPAVPLTITYQTSISDNLLLPGGTVGKKITNAADLFGGKNGEFNRLSISGKSTVTIPQPTWLTKTGKTTREPGNGSTTDWTVTFQPNGFSFEDSNNLTLYDQLPDRSTLVDGSVKVNGAEATATPGTNNDFTISPITTDNQPVTITYQSHVEEDTYDSGTSLGSNVAWFTFKYGDQDYKTPEVKKDVGSGDGSGTPGTATLVKTNTGYNKTDRTIVWTATINPHKAYLKSGTFTDNLGAAGPRCTAGHTSGLELVGGTKDITVKINGGDPTDAEKALINLEYSQQELTIKVGEIGANTITLTYTTKVCDPCVFANNTAKVAFKNTISTSDMIIGKQSNTGRSASADSTADVSAVVLSKKAPVYDYASGIMKWTVEVDAAGLPMSEVILTDELPAGLTYVENTLSTNPAITDASASVAGQKLTINLGTVKEKTTITFDTKADPETLGFRGDKPVTVANTICMKGSADEIPFAEVSHSVRQNFSNHGLVKSSAVNNQQEFIQYEVLINPFGLALPENPSLADTLDKRLQLDPDTLRFYEATLSGTTNNKDQKPGYTKTGDGQPLQVTSFDPGTNSFTVQIPIGADSRAAYVLAYRADIIDYQADGYSNSVSFDGGSVLLGGSKNNSAAVGGGGGGGGGGIAARKAVITIAKADSENQTALAGVSFTLYQWDSDNKRRGLPFAQGKTDAQGKLSFKVKPNAAYELVETESVSGYGSAIGWNSLPAGVTETDAGLLVTAGAAKSELTLELTNEPHTTDLVFRLVNESGIPMTGEKVQIFTSDPTGKPDLAPVREVTVSTDGTVRFPGMRRGAKYYVRKPDGNILSVEVPAQLDDDPTVTLPDGTTAVLTANYLITGTTAPDQQWTLTVNKVISGGTTPLPGAAIGLYADESCRILIKTDVSGQDGTIIFSGLIKGQSYWLKETAAPAGYHLDSAIYEGSEANSTVVIANTPGNSGNTGTPDEPGTPSEPGTPGEPDTPSEPGAPSESDTPNKPGTPSESGTPSKPGTPNEPSTPVSPGNGGSNNSTNGLNIPQTGDDTQRLIAVTLVSGILLAVVTIYRRFMAKRRGQK